METQVTGGGRAAPTDSCDKGKRGGGRETMEQERSERESKHTVTIDRMLN